MKKSILLFLIPFCISCSEKKNAKQELYYFSLKNFFQDEVKRLNSQKPLVNKSVIHNGKLEEKKIQLSDWSTELSLFRESDINKNSWKNSFRKDSSDKKIVYTSLDDDIRTKKIEIIFGDHQQVEALKVLNSTRNFLYQSSEELTYFPDSLYQIHKKQQVFILGENDYLITSLF